MKVRKQLIAAATGALLALGYSAFAQGAKPSDPQIVGIVTTANQIDIDAAKLALKKSQNKDVKEFAQGMVDDHTKLQKSVNDLGAKLKVKPEPSDTSKSLKTAATAETKKLNGLKGSAFDKEYIDHEVAYHQQVIDAASKVLIPSAQNAELKSALESAAPLFQGHLEHAQKIQSSLGGK